MNNWNQESRTSTLAVIWQKVERVKQMDPNQKQYGFPLDVLLPGILYPEIGIASVVMSVIAGADASASEEILLEKAKPLLDLWDAGEKTKKISEQIKVDIRKAMLEASRLSGDSVNALTCGGCGGPVGVHDQSCGWCESGLTHSH